MIVLLKDAVPSAAPVASEHARTRHAQVKHVYDTALRGYAATVPDDQLPALRQDPRVEAVVADKAIHLDRPTARRARPDSPPFPQIIPYGIDRVEADVSTTHAGDQKGHVNAGVAIIDSGVGPHDDINIAGGVNCGNEGGGHDFTDHLGHGTAVAGVVGAKDNRWDFVGAAPGVRIWVAKVADADFTVPDSNVLCALDWVAEHTGVIDVVNISLGIDGSDDGNCGRTNHDPLHRAICRVVGRGITIVVSAGNEAQDASTKVPAAYDEVITVSAMADFDGIPGGLDRYGKGAADPSCLGVHDDTPAFFTNFGADVDLTAPGVCVSTTLPYDANFNPDPNGYTSVSGTSFSAPHVAGAAALYKSRHPHASPARVRAALVAAGSSNYDDSWDPDGIKEPLLNMASF